MAQRTLAPKINTWRANKLIKDLATNDKTLEQLADEHGVALSTLYAFKAKNQDAIDAVIAGWVAEHEHIWSVRKEERIMFLTQRIQEIEHHIDVLLAKAWRATEEVRRLEHEEHRERTDS